MLSASAAGVGLDGCLAEMTGRMVRHIELRPLAWMRRCNSSLVSRRMAARTRRFSSLYRGRSPSRRAARRRAISPFVASVTGRITSSKALSGDKTVNNWYGHTRKVVPLCLRVGTFKHWSPVYTLHEPASIRHIQLTPTPGRQATVRWSVIKHRHDGQRPPVWAKVSGVVR